MKTFVKGALLLLLVAMFATGCSLTNAGVGDKDLNNANNQIGQIDNVKEDDVSPVPEDTVDPVKKEVTFTFSDDNLMDMYRVNQEVEAGSEDDLPKAALELWLEGPQQDGLTNLVPPEVIIEKVEFNDGVAYVSFSQEIKNANLGSGGEMFLINQIALLMQQFGYDSTQILVNGEVEDSVLGHVTTSEPIPAPDPESYEWFAK